MSMKRGAEKDGTAREARAFHNWRGRGAAVATVLVVLLSVVLLYLFSDGLSMPQSPFFSVLSPGDDPFIAQTEAGKCRIYFLDVGQGNATLFSVGDEGYVLVDTGPEDAEASLLAMLSELGVERIEYLVLTHPHDDHIGGADGVLGSIPVGQTLMPEETSNTASFQSLLLAIERNGCKLKLPRAGEVFALGKLSMTIMSPLDTDASEDEDENERCLTLRATFGASSIFLAADVGEPIEAELLDRYPAAMLRVDLLGVGHHGAATSSGADFLSALSPKYAVISCGKNNSYGHPSDGTLERLGEAGVEVFRTDRDGTVVFVTDGTHLTAPKR